MPLLSREFLARPAHEAAPALLGCVVEHSCPEGLVAVELTEVEAYGGDADPASHACRGRTARNEVMFGPPGRAYVYFTYGMHFCLNVVCMPEGTASAVLLRAGRVIRGQELARSRRSPGRMPGQGAAPPVPDRELARGPGRLCRVLGVSREQNGRDMCAADSPLRLRWPDGSSPGNEPREVSAGPRVGVSAGAETRWRFWRPGDETVSAYRAAARRGRVRR